MAITSVSGHLRKLTAQLSGNHEVFYQLPVGDHRVELNGLLGQVIRIAYTEQINCCHCGRKTRKSYSQGYCFPCMQSLAQCDICIVKPERCHYAQGSCREPEWGGQHCMTDHIVYLANTSGLKVGITRANQVPTRWIDQGATQALAIYRVSTRLQAGLVEVALADRVADKTNWRALLKGAPEPCDLTAAASQLRPQIAERLSLLAAQYGSEQIQAVNESPQTLKYPVLEYPKKVQSYNLDKTPIIEDTLIGIKGQYLIFANGVVNIRKYTSYQVVVDYNT